MHKEGFYSSGEFARLAMITKKTLRYYDEKAILKPSFLTEKGARFYTDADLARLQQILLLKYLGFSLNDVKEMLVNETDNEHLGKMLKVQRKLVEDRIEQLNLVAKTIQETQEDMAKGQSINWSQMLELIRMTGMETNMRNQYRNASNISARISLHRMFSKNKKGWFSWIFDRIPFENGSRILEVGCGDGQLWLSGDLPDDVEITLSDKSDGMLRDARRNLSEKHENGVFQYVMFDAQHLPFADESFDVVIANHVLFYCEQLDLACTQIARVLKPGGILIAGTYGKNHMKEIGEMVQEFDERIVLSAEHLYDAFGKENGKQLLAPYFSDVSWEEYEDSLCVTEVEPLISYVLSCHGNQNQYIVDNYPEFKSFVKKKTEKGFAISKEAGIFFAKK